MDCAKVYGCSLLYAFPVAKNLENFLMSCQSPIEQIV